MNNAVFWYAVSETSNPQITLKIHSNSKLSVLEEVATIRVTHLPKDIAHADLQELFRPFGSISRIYLVKDKATGQSKVTVVMSNT